MQSNNMIQQNQPRHNGLGPTENLDELNKKTDMRNKMLNFSSEVK